MEPIPVNRAQQPAYPTRREVLAGAAAFALANLASGSFVFAESEAGEITVAPIFAHGEGRGTAGCVVVSPPVFLSEEEGMQILREELAKHGVQLKAGETLDGVLIPVRIEKFEFVKNGEGKMEIKEVVVEAPDRAIPLKVDGIDSTKKVGVEFISRNDHSRLRQLDCGCFSSISNFDFKETAEYVVAKVKKQGKDRIFLGVFYDPLAHGPVPQPLTKGEKVDWETAWKKRREQGVEESKNLLRQQAQDYIAWLKKQKAI